MKNQPENKIPQIQQIYEFFKICFLHHVNSSYEMEQTKKIQSPYMILQENFMLNIHATLHKFIMKLFHI